MAPIERPLTSRLSIASGSIHPGFAADIAEGLGTELVPLELRQFPNGEFYARFDETVRGSDVYVVQAHQSMGRLSINDAIHEQAVILNAAREASARKVIAVCPFLGYSRQDRKAKPREPLSAALNINGLISPRTADGMITVDLHTSQLQSSTDKVIDHVTAQPVLVEAIGDWIADKPDGKVTIVAPDAGRAPMARNFADELGLTSKDIAFINKEHDFSDTSHVSAQGVVGNVEGRYCVVVDDMVDTAGTLKMGVELLKREGALGIIAVATHGILSEYSPEQREKGKVGATENILGSQLEKLIVTDTLNMFEKELGMVGRLEVRSVAQSVGETIMRVFMDDSVSEQYSGFNYS